jgi:hypothetical protein
MLSELTDQVQQYFNDIRLYAEVAALFSIFTFLVVASLGSVIAWHVVKIARATEAAHTLAVKQSSQSQIPYSRQNVYGPQNPYGSRP